MPLPTYYGHGNRHGCSCLHCYDVGAQERRNRPQRPLAYALEKSCAACAELAADARGGKPEAGGVTRAMDEALDWHGFVSAQYVVEFWKPCIAMLLGAHICWEPAGSGAQDGKGNTVQAGADFLADQRADDSE